MFIDRENRPFLAFGLLLYALLMGLMAAAASGIPIVGTLAVWIAVPLAWPLIFASYVCGIAWLGDAPIVQRWNAGGWLAQTAAGAVFFAGILLIAFGLFAVWCRVSALSYAFWCALCAVASVRQFRLHREEERFLLGIRVSPVARLVK